MIERAAGAAGGLAFGVLFGLVAAARRDKALHPKGVVHEATLTVEPGSPAPAAATLLSMPGEHPAVVRLSRAIGLPSGVPDILGLAIRVPNAYGPGRHQDILLASSADGPLSHHLLVPAVGAKDRPYTSLLPYAAGGERFLLGALPRPYGFALAVAALSGRFVPVARLALGEQRGDEPLAFDIHENTGGGLAPSGAINRMRRLAYPMAQRPWRRT